MTSTLAIGDFARATHLSVKTLRYYHEVGLLEPVAIDPDTGYRRYASEQIRTAQIIRRFRDLRMPLEQIDAVLKAPDVGARSTVLAEHLAQLEGELNETKRAVASLRNLLEGPRSALDITHRTEVAMETASITSVVDLEDLGPWFQGALGELYGTVTSRAVTVAGPPGAVITNEFFAEERGEITIFLPISDHLRPIGRVTQCVLPAVELATIVHHGAHDDVDRAYGTLATYVAERALAIDEPIRERYLIGPRDTDDASRWRTEIGWPIFDTRHGVLATPEPPPPRP